MGKDGHSLLLQLALLFSYGTLQLKKGKCLNEHAVRPSLSELVEFDEVCLSVLIVICTRNIYIYTV